MTKYIENVNVYLSQMKIKQTYISLKTGIDGKKLSRILTGVQDINSTDMEKIASALGKKMDFFMKDSFLSLRSVITHRKKLLFMQEILQNVRMKLRESLKI